MVMEIKGSYKLTYHPVEDDPDKVFEVDFTPPFKRISMIEELERILGVQFPPPTQFNTPGVFRVAVCVCVCVFCMLWSTFCSFSFPKVS